MDKAPQVHELPGQKGRERVISFEEEARYLRAASPTLRDVAVLAADTGLRLDSELFTLRWADVHLEESSGAPHGYIHVQAGKTESAVRNVPLTPRAQAVLEMRKANGNGGRYVFPGSGRTGHIVTV